MVLGLGVVACGGGDDGSSTATTGRLAAAPVPTTAATPAAAPAAAGAAVPAVLEFEAPLLGGGEFDARTYAGQPLALWFWAPY